MTRFTSHQGNLLVQLARQTIANALDQPGGLERLTAVKNQIKEDIFRTHLATFVTLTLDGQLRGCIGSLVATEPVCDNIEKNAINAAFHDPRFHPLSAAELSRTTIDISILSEPSPLKFVDDHDLLQKLRPQIDGVIIRRGGASATFLPQVWEQLPKPQQFLSNLCLKAGLSSDAWQRQDVDVATYQVQYFKESATSHA